MPEFVRRVVTPPEIHELHAAGRSTTGHLEDRAASASWAVDDLDFQVEKDGMHFRGYAAIFDSASEDLGGFREYVRPSAFNKTLGEKRAIKMFWNHDQGRPLGSTQAAPGRGLLTLAPDKRGLLADVRLPDTTDGRDMAELVRSRIVDSMSFGFAAVRDAWPSDGERELHEVRLWEVSPVTGWPAYQGTSAGVRHLAAAIGAAPSALELATVALLRGDLTDEQRELLEAALVKRPDGILLRNYQRRLAMLARMVDDTRHKPGGKDHDQSTHGNWSDGADGDAEPSWGDRGPQSEEEYNAGDYDLVARDYFEEATDIVSLALVSPSGGAYKMPGVKVLNEHVAPGFADKIGALVKAGFVQVEGGGIHTMVRFTKLTQQQVDTLIKFAPQMGRVTLQKYQLGQAGAMFSNQGSSKASAVEIIKQAAAHGTPGSE